MTRIGTELVYPDAQRVVCVACRTHRHAAAITCTVCGCVISLSLRRAVEEGIA